MVDTIVHHHNVRLVHLPVMMNPVLLHGFGVYYCDLHRPHTGQGEQHHLITPEVPSQQKMQVLAVQQWRSPPPSLLNLWILLNLNTIVTRQRPVLALQDVLVVMGQEADHHPPEIPIREVGGLLQRGRTNFQMLFNGRKQTVARSIHLQIK